MRSAIAARAPLPQISIHANVTGPEHIQIIIHANVTGSEHIGPDP
jgi:hypothetical protein